MADGARRDLTFRFLGDTKSLESASSRASRSLGGVDDASGKASKSVQLLGKAAIAMGSAFAASQVVRGIGDSITAASNLGESINAVQVVTGDAADEILALGETAAQSLGLSKRAVNEAAVAFAAFGEKIAPGNVGGVFEDYIQRATDFASVMNLDVQEALDKFRSGLAGESEPLRAFGIDVSAAAVGAYAVANGIAESAAKMTEAEKIQARYGLIMEQTAKTAGDFANTSDSLANSQRRLSAEWENAQAEIGQNLVPAMEALIPLLIGASKAAGDMAQSFGLGLKAVTNLDAALGLSTDAMFEFERIAGHVQKRLEDGATPATVVAEAMAHLGREGALTAESMDALQAATGASGEEMNRATKYVVEHATELGVAADSVDAVAEASAKYGRELDQNTIKAQDDFAEGARELAHEVKNTSDEVEDLAEETESLREVMRKAADPVYAARSAVEAYEKALEAAREDAVITGDELIELADKFADAEIAKEGLTEGSFKAFSDQLVETANAAGATATALSDARNQVSAMVGRGGELDSIVRRIEEVAGKRITIDLAGLRMASASDIEAEVTRALLSLQRQGVVRNIYL